MISKFKILSLILVYIIWHQTQIFLSTNITAPNSIVDKLHDSNIFSLINLFLSENIAFTKYNFILSSMLIDISAIYIIINYLRADNSKTLFIFFFGLILRQLCQFINRLPVPQNMIWFYPDFPSILVTYDIENDFFFSGHTFIALAAGLEILSNKNYLYKCCGLFFMAYEILFIISINGHYFMDIYAAFTTYFMLNYFYDKFFSTS